MANNKDRQRWEKLYGPSYVRFGYKRDDEGNIASQQPCAYCGNVATGVDHVPPLKWAYALGSSYFQRLGIVFIRVPACKECNTELSDRKLFTLRERNLYLIGRYTKKYKKLLVNTLWEDYEIEEMVGNLKTCIEQFSVQQLAIDRRLRVIESSLRPNQLG